MTPASNRPDLCRIGESAFTEVLGTLFSLPATPQKPSSQRFLRDAPNEIANTVLLAGQGLSGSVHLLLPLPFIAQAVKHLTDLDGTERDAVQEDTAGEIANMVAGRIAVQLAAHGYPCTLGTPSVIRHGGLRDQPEPGVDTGRIELFCGGHCLSLELQCRYAVP